MYDDYININEDENLDSSKEETPKEETVEETATSSEEKTPKEESVEETANEYDEEPDK